MKEKESTIVGGLTLFLLILWLGFFIHRDPRFAGSLVGGIFAVTGSLFLLIPLIYSIIKRFPSLTKKVTPKFPLSTLLTIHIYAGVIGAILVLIHTGHKFDGPLATTLTAFLLLEVASGFIGRYLFGQIIKDLSEKKKLAASLTSLFTKESAELSTQPKMPGLIKSFFVGEASDSSSFAKTRTLGKLAGAVSDVEYSIKSHELFKKYFSHWLKIHIVMSFIFYGLLFSHIGSEIYFGLRWFQ
jgi:hypothetical protein